MTCIHWKFVFLKFYRVKTKSYLTATTSKQFRAESYQKNTQRKVIKETYLWAHDAETSQKPTSSQKRLLNTKELYIASPYSNHPVIEAETTQEHRLFCRANKHRTSLWLQGALPLALPTLARTALWAWECTRVRSLCLHCFVLSNYWVINVCGVKRIWNNSRG